MIKDKRFILNYTYSRLMDCKSQCMTNKNELSDEKCTIYPKDVPKDIWIIKRKDCKFFKSLEEE